MSTVAPPTAMDFPDRDGVMAQAGSENFTVASALVGHERQRHLRAIYGFARLVDDVGDEAPGNRMGLLEVVSDELERVYDGAPRHPVMVELQRTVRACRLPSRPFQRLIEANRVDQVQTRYRTFEQLLGYCQLSAAPVGELVLHVFDAATPDRIALSDRICAGLQIVEHLQDIAEDRARGRVYMPEEDVVRFGCKDEDLAGAGTASRRALVAFEADRARRLLAAGAPLARTLPPRPRLAIAGFVAGGRAALDALQSDSRSGPRVAYWFMRSALGR
ncbi:MAG TPA: squalene synthase HpnC [Solirubrobacteraceae bacterium]|nr:squalene synthase HpnC [Solirubrobacteraceae bacterium]